MNIHAAEVQRQSVDWAVRMGLIRDSRRAKLEQARIGYLVARAFPEGRRVGLQIAADWTTLFCVADDYAETLASPVRVAAYFLDRVARFHDEQEVTEVRCNFCGKVTRLSATEVREVAARLRAVQS